VKIPLESIIPNEKLTQYLLVYKARNDKSKFLAQAEFTQENPEALRSAIQLIIISGEAIEDRTNEYGTFYQVDGEVIGINGVTLLVTTIWLKRQVDNKFQFITLKPRKELDYVP
jgi:alpha-amylase/alpha-mannosidase (GH57 family)